MTSGLTTSCSNAPPYVVFKYSAIVDVAVGVGVSVSGAAVAIGIAVLVAARLGARGNGVKELKEMRLGYRQSSGIVK